MGFSSQGHKKSDTTEQLSMQAQVHRICGLLNRQMQNGGYNKTQDAEEYFIQEGFPYSSVGKESACHAGNPGLIPGLGSSTGEGMGYPPQYFGLPLWLSW